MEIYDKQTARRVVSERLNQVPLDDYLLASVTVRRRVYTLLSELSTSGKPKSVLSYRASSQWSEVDLGLLKHALPGIQFDYVPLDAKAAFFNEVYDVILVPLYGFTAGGYRLGHGGGWFDQFLATQPQACKVGVGCEANRIEFVHEPHDIPMDIVITEMA